MDLAPFVGGCGEVIHRAIAEVVGSANIEFHHVDQGIEPGDDETAQGVEPGGMAEGDEIEPTTAARATSGCAVFVALLADLLSNFVILLSWERAFTDAGGVGFADAESVVDVAGADSGAEACAAGGRVAARDIGVCAVVEIKECALCAFEKDAVATADGFLEDGFGVGDERFEPLGIAAIFFVEVFKFNGLTTEKGDQAIFEFEDLEEPFAEDFRVDEFAHADADALDFVGVHWANATRRRADFIVASGGFFELVNETMVRENDVGGGRDFEGTEVGLQFAGAIDFFKKSFGADRHSSGEDREGVGVENSGGEEVEFECFSASDDGVPGVVAAAVADDIAGLVPKDVDDFAFGFIAPLRSDDYEG